MTRVTEQIYRVSMQLEKFSTIFNIYFILRKKSENCVQINGQFVAAENG